MSLLLALSSAQLYNGIDSTLGRYVLKQRTESIEETFCVFQDCLNYKLTDILTTD